MSRKKKKGGDREEKKENFKGGGWVGEKKKKKINSDPGFGERGEKGRRGKGGGKPPPILYRHKEKKERKEKGEGGPPSRMPCSRIKEGKKKCRGKESAGVIPSPQGRGGKEGENGLKMGGSADGRNKKKKK